MAVKPVAGRGKGLMADDEPAAPSTDDDPFAIDPSVAAGAIPVSRQPAAGKTLEVVCPMCETKGFVSPKAAGKQVKCCNPQCMVPIFSAPALEKKEVVAPPPKKKKKIPWAYVGAGILVAGLVSYFVWLKMQGPGIQDIAADNTKFYVPGSSSNGSPAADNGTKNGASDGGKTNNPDKVDGPRDTEQIRQEIIKQALERILEVSFKTERHRKDLWRRLAITAYLSAGDEKEARAQLDVIKKNAPSEGVLPVVGLAWRQASRPAEFKQLVGETKTLADKLPPRGRYATEAAVATAPLLVASGKSDDARKLLAKHPSEPLVEQLAAALRVVVEDETYNLDAVLMGRTVGDWQRPLETAVTLILMAHGRWDDALAWATQAEDPVAKAEASIAWAEGYVRQAVPADDAAGWKRAVDVGQQLTAEGKTRLLARLAAVKLSKGDRPGAEELIAQAVQSLKAIPEAKPIRIASVKEVYDLKLPDARATVTLWQSALAAAEIAGVQAQLGHADTAWSNVRLALEMMREIGPSLGAMHERRAQLDKNPNGVQGELARELGLKKKDDITSALNRYKQRFRDAEAAAVQRFYGLVTIFESATKSGLLDQVWDELQAIDRKSLLEREPFLSTALPLLVAARFEVAGNSQKKEEIHGIVQQRIDPSDPQVVEQYAEQFFKASDLPGCLGQLNAAMTPKGILHETALRLACRLVSQGEVAEAISFCNRINDPTIREDGLFLTAALASRTGKGEAYWKAAGEQGLSPMESAAVCSGIVVGFGSHATDAK